MKRYIYSSKSSSLDKFEGFDKKKYHDLYINLFRTILDGINVEDEDYNWSDVPSVESNIQEAFKMVDGAAEVHLSDSSEVLIDNYIYYRGWVNGDREYRCGGSINFNSLWYDARSLAQKLAMGYFKTTEGSNVDCNIYEFIDWMSGDIK